MSSHRRGAQEGRERGARRRALGSGLALALLLAPGVLGCGAQGPAAAPHPVAVSITIANTAGQPVPRGFLGLSFEVAALPQIASYADRGDLATLLRSLGPGMLRFGGVSADTRTAWTDRLRPRPAWASGVLGAADLRRLGRLTSRTDWRVLLTIGLIHYDAGAGAREAAAARAALGGSLAAVEVGNEPDAYGRHHFRASGWAYGGYDAQVRRYREAIDRTAPGIPLAGPGVSGSRAFATWGPGEARSQRPALLTGHHYPLGCHQVPPPSIARLLSPATRAKEADSLSRYMAVSRQSSIPFRLDETNSVSCGGELGISNTFAAALWAAGYITQTMSAGVSGINLEGNPVNCRGYTPLCAPTPADLSRGELRAQPEWYALLLSRALVGERPVASTLASRGHPNLVVHAFRGPRGLLHVVIVEDDPPGSASAAVSVHLPSSYRLARVLALTAPSPSATEGVTLGGRGVAGDGSWSEPPALPRIAVQRGSLTLTIAPSRAILLTIER
jgi:hypothetical protein